MKNTLFFILLLLLPCCIKAQQIDIRLDSNAYAAVLTCGAGDDFYTTFGHSALRICDTANNLDIVYNYGTFDFSTKHFYWKFALGKLNYCLARTSMQHFMLEYVYEGRVVRQQRLNLSNQELNNLFVLLEQNYLPQYRFYRYDFFTDNCATRVRDIINASLDHRTAFAPHDVPNAMSYRQMLRTCTDGSVANQWWQTGIDMLLGLRCDHRCNSMEYMFLPDNMLAQLDTLAVVPCRSAADSALVPFAQPHTILFDADSSKKEDFQWWGSPLAVSIYIMLIVLVLTIISFFKGWKLAWLDTTLFSIMGIASLALIFFWAFSAYACTKWNLNLLWASPLFIYFVFRPNSSPRWLWWLQIGLLLAALAVGVCGVQRLPYFAYFIIFTLAIRIFSKIIKHKQ